MKVKIDSAKIHYWLSQRKKIPSNALARLTSIQEILMEFLNNQTSISNPIINNFLNELKIYHHIVYSDLENLLSLLINSREGEQKSFFGNYKSPIINQLIKIKKSYQKQNLDLFSVAYRIQDSLTVLIPNIQNLIKSEKNEIQYLKLKIIKYKEKQEHYLKIYQLDAQKIPKNIGQLLHQEFKEIYSKTSILKNAITYFQRYCKQLSHQHYQLKFLKYFIEKGINVNAQSLLTLNDSPDQINLDQSLSQNMAQQQFICEIIDQTEDEKGKTLQPILKNRQARQKILLDLLQLGQFYSYVDQTPIQLIETKIQIKKIIQMMQNKQFILHIRIHNNKKQMDELIFTLQQNKRQAQRYNLYGRQSQSKLKKCEAQLAQFQSKLTRLKKRNYELKIPCQKLLSQTMNTEVQLIGSILA